MPSDIIQNMIIDELMSFDVGLKIRQIMEAVASVQRGLYTIIVNEDDVKLDLLKIGTVFQIFLIDALAAGKKPEDLTNEDWKNIADQVYKYAVIEDGQRYSEFIFTLYANYIDISVMTLRDMVSEDRLSAIQELSDTIRHNTEQLRKEEIKEADYIEACLWLSLEAMMKLLASFFTMGIAQEYAELVQAASQLAFEYGRYVLYAKERMILEQYIQNQYMLDDQLRKDYEDYLSEVRIQAEEFQKLINGAFSTDIQEALVQSAALARKAGVPEAELLTTVEDIDAFFM